MLTLAFPNVPGSPGSPLPAHGSQDPNPTPGAAQQLGGLTRSDYEGWSLNKNERQSWQADPAGGPRVVCRFEVHGTDIADQYEGCRCTLWRNPDNQHGTEAWVGMGFLIPTGFVYPDTWFLLYQMFSSGGNPAQAIELMKPPNAGQTRNYLFWKNQTAPTSGRVYKPLGPVAEGHWNYIVINARFSSGLDGFDRVWYAIDQVPDVTKNPTVNWSGKTLYDTKPGRENILLYRDPSTNPKQIQVVYYSGLYRGTTSDDVIQALKRT